MIAFILLFSILNIFSVTFVNSSEDYELAVPRRPIIDNPSGLIPTTYELKEGEDLKLNCTLKQGSPPPPIKWLKDGRPLNLEKDFGHFVVQEYDLLSSSLWLRNVTEKVTEGGYSCNAVNFLGKSSRHFFINVVGSNVVWLNENNKVR